MERKKNEKDKLKKIIYLYDNLYLRHVMLISRKLCRIIKNKGTNLSKPNITIFRYF